MKPISILCCGVLTATLLFSGGCAESEDSSSRTKKAVQGTTITTTILSGAVGTEQNVDGAVVTLNGVYQSDITNNRNGFGSSIIFFSFTVSNQTSAPIEANFMQTCQIELDGASTEAFTIKALQATFQQFGSDVEIFEDPIPAGETVTGYIGAEVYDGYEEGTLLYTPLAGGTEENKDASKLIRYTFRPEELESIDTIDTIDTMVTTTAVTTTAPME